MLLGPGKWTSNNGKRKEQAGGWGITVLFLSRSKVFLLVSWLLLGGQNGVPTACLDELHMLKDSFGGNRLAGGGFDFVQTTNHC
jgi:hypothetical protein